MIEDFISAVIDFSMVNADAIIQVGLPIGLFGLGIGLGGLIVAGIFTAIEWFDKADSDYEEEDYDESTTGKE